MFVVDSAGKSGASSVLSGCRSKPQSVLAGSTMVLDDASHKSIFSNNNSHYSVTTGGGVRRWRFTAQHIAAPSLHYTGTITLAWSPRHTRETHKTAHRRDALQQNLPAASTDEVRQATCETRSALSSWCRKCCRASHAPPSCVGGRLDPSLRCWRYQTTGRTARL